MPFWDEIDIKVEAGKGGDGLVSFAHERTKPKAGPDGGDGGNGGNITFRANEKISDLTFYSYHKFIKAENGKNGGRNRKTGKSGKDLFLELPLGTEIYIFDKENRKWNFVLDFEKEGQEYIIVRGGKGGWGNVHFLTATHQSPKTALPGKLGEKKKIRLVFKMIAEVGLVGLPNSGKSTLLSVISCARPKIAAYPFTTISPNLGIVEAENKKFVVADIPGLIEGAFKGKGLGDKFLKHIERTKIIVLLIDATSENPFKNYLILEKELESYKKGLSGSNQIIVLTKIDSAQDFLKKQRDLERKTKKIVIPISSQTHQNVTQLLKVILLNLKKPKIA